MPKKTKKKYLQKNKINNASAFKLNFVLNFFFKKINFA